MNDNAQKLVIALRSGEFEQTQGHLRDESGHCCLGVACELYRREVGGEWKNNGFIVPGSSFAEHFALPQPVRAWLGFRDDIGTYDADESEALTDDNDDGKSFASIADIIEDAQGLFE